MAQSILKSFAPVMKDGVHSSWNGPKGVLYNFNIEFENGDAGQCNSTKTNPSWKIGSEYTYEITTDNRGYKHVKSLKDLSRPAEAPQSYSKGNYQPQDPNQNYYIAKQVSYEVATDMIAFYDQTSFTDKVSTKEGLITSANKFLAYIMEATDKQVNIIRQSSLRRAVKQMNIPVLGVKNADGIIERAKEIEKYILTLPA